VIINYLLGVEAAAVRLDIMIFSIYPAQCRLVVAVGLLFLPVALIP
jgi:hypothetical protein